MPNFTLYLTKLHFLPALPVFSYYNTISDQALLVSKWKNTKSIIQILQVYVTKMKYIYHKFQTLNRKIFISVLESIFCKLYSQVLNP